jgi:hypothetical protein
MGTILGTSHAACDQTGGTSFRVLSKSPIENGAVTAAQLLQSRARYDESGRSIWNSLTARMTEAVRASTQDPGR